MATSPARRSWCASRCAITTCERPAEQVLTCRRRCGRARGQRPPKRPAPTGGAQQAVAARRDAELLAEGAREVEGIAVADAAGDRADRQAPVLEQRGGALQAARAHQVPGRGDVVAAEQAAEVGGADPAGARGVRQRPRLVAMGLEPGTAAGIAGVGGLLRALARHQPVADGQERGARQGQAKRGRLRSAAAADLDQQVEDAAHQGADAQLRVRARRDAGLGERCGRPAPAEVEEILPERPRALRGDVVRDPGTVGEDRAWSERDAPAREHHGATALDHQLQAVPGEARARHPVALAAELPAATGHG